MSNHVLQSSNDAADKLSDVKEAASVQLEYVMGKKNCIRIKNDYPVIHNLLAAYGAYFKVLHEAKIAEENAQKVLNHALKDFLKNLPETKPARKKTKA
jgi:hypothetical protein